MKVSASQRSSYMLTLRVHQKCTNMGNPSLSCARLQRKTKLRKDIHKVCEITEEL